MIDEVLLKRLTRELRAANGIERTPSQVAAWLDSNSNRPNSFIRRVMDDPDLLLDLANRMRIPYLDKAPNVDED